MKRSDALSQVQMAPNEQDYALYCVVSLTLRRFVWLQPTDSAAATYASEPKVTVPVRVTLLAVVVGAVASSVRKRRSR